MTRRSSLVDSPELRYYCRSCRAENVMDLPHWHWGQVRTRRQELGFVCFFGFYDYIPFILNYSGRQT